MRNINMQRVKEKRRNEEEEEEKNEKKRKEERRKKNLLELREMALEEFTGLQFRGFLVSFLVTPLLPQ